MNKLISFFIQLFFLGFQFTLIGQSVDTTMGKKYLELAELKIDQGEFKEGLEFSQKAVRTFEASAEHEKYLAKALYFLGKSEYHNGKYEKANIAYKKAAALLELYNDDESKETTASIFEDLGILRKEKYLLDEALDYFNRALSIRQSIFGESNRNVAKSYADIGMIYRYKERYRKASEYFDKALNISFQTLPHNHNQIGYINTQKGIVQKRQGNDILAREFFQNALDISLFNRGEKHPATASCYYNLGIVNRRLGEYKKASYYYNKALSIRIEVYENDMHPKLASIYNTLGIVYERQGDFHKGMEYYKKAIAIARNSLGEDHPKVALYYKNIGDAYINIGNFEKANEYLQRSLRIRIKSSGKINSEVAFSYFALGRLHYFSGEYSLAIDHNKEAAEIFTKLFGKKHQILSKCYNNIGIAYHTVGDYQFALDYSKKSLMLDSISPQNSYFNLGNTYLKLGDTLQAVRSFEKNIFSSGFDWKEQKIENLNYAVDVNILDSFSKLAMVRPKIESETLPDQLQILSIIDKTIDHFIKTIEDPNSVIDYKKQTFKLSEDAISTTVGEKSKEKQIGFYFAEKSKATVLLSNIRNTYSDGYHNIPDSLQKQDRDIGIAINQWRRLAHQEEQKDSLKNDSLLNTFNSKLFELKRKQENLNTELEINYPDYYKLKYDNSVSSVQEIQQLLDDDQMLLEYFVGDSSVFIFALSPTQYEIKEIKKDFPLDRWVKKMRDAIYLPVIKRELSKIQKDSLKSEYVDYASKLHDKLISNIPLELSKDLIIIPDGVLSYLPFDALLKTKPNKSAGFSEYHYMIKDHTISYNYSATLYKEVRDKKASRKEKQFLGVAPHFDVDDRTATLASNDLRDTLTHLIWNVPEVGEICKLVNGDSLLKQDATLPNFLEIASNYNIIHLSTHSTADDKTGNYSYIAFTEIKDSIDNENLYVQDLYNIELNSDMIVMSACETGLGKLERGEGVIGMTRGFLYAGAKSIITSLWRINDKSSKEIMGYFYSNLKGGENKDEALRQAKLSYINKNKAKSSPFYWAAFVPIGDMESIDLTADNFNWLGWVMLALALFSSGCFWFIRNKKQKEPQV